MDLNNQMAPVSVMSVLQPHIHIGFGFWLPCLSASGTGLLPIEISHMAKDPALPLHSQEKCKVLSWAAEPGSRSTDVPSSDMDAQTMMHILLLSEEDQEDSTDGLF